MPDSPSESRSDLLVLAICTALVKWASLIFIYEVNDRDILAVLSGKWDSVFYTSIAQHGYPPGSVTGNYAFAPGLPAIIWAVNLAVGNYQLAAAVVSNVFSFLAVFAFYYAARLFLPPRRSLQASLAFAFFPTFVTYGLVAYSEPVYLFFSILAVYFFLKDKYFLAGSASSLAVLSGYSSLLIPLIFLGMLVLRKTFSDSKGSPGVLRMEEHRSGLNRFRFLWLAMPVVVFFLWMLVLDARSGVTFAPIVAQGPWGTAVANPVAQVQEFFTGVFSTQGDPVQQMLVRYAYVVPFLLLVIPLWKVNEELALYSAVFMIFVLSLVGTAYMSGPRLMLAAWPVLLVFGRMRSMFVVPMLIIFAVLSFQSTNSFLTSFWA